MKLTGRIVAVLVLAASAASLAQADARPRSGKHVASPARQHQAGAAIKHRGNANSGAPSAAKNAIGVATPPTATLPGAPGRGTSAGTNAGGVRANAIGVHVGTSALPPSGPPAARIGAGATPTNGLRPAPPALSAHGAISGTGMARPGGASGTIGGPAKVVGGISGTSVRVKH